MIIRLINVFGIVNNGKEYCIGYWSGIDRGCLKTIKLPKYKLTVIGKKLEIARITQPPTPNPEPRCLSIQTASIGWEPYSHSFFDEKTSRIVKAAMFDSNIWLEFDRGILTEEEIIRRMVAKAPDYEKQIRYYIDNVGCVCSKKEYSAPLIKSLKAKLGLADPTQFIVNNV